MLIYIILYITILFISFADVSGATNKTKYQLLIFQVIIITLFRGLRWETGTDWEQFEVCFSLSSWDNIFDYDRYGNGRETMEFGWMFLNRFLKIFGDYTLFLILTNLILVGTWGVLSWKLVPQKPLMTFAMIMVSNLFFPVRLQIAAGFFCVALFYYSQRKYIATGLFILLSCTIHKSALFLVPIFFLLSKRFSTIKISLFLLITLLSPQIASYLTLIIVGVSVLINPYYPSLASNLLIYTDAPLSGAKEQSTLGFIISTMFIITVVIYFIAARAQLEKRCRNSLSKENIRNFNIFLNGYVFFIFIMRFFDIEALANFKRICEYLTISFSITFFMSYLELRRKIPEKYLFIFYIFFYLYRLKGMLSTSYPDELYPYKSIFGIL